MFKITISKTSVYNELKNLNITRKKIKYRTILTKKSKHNKQIKNFKKEISKIILGMRTF